MNTILEKQLFLFDLDGTLYREDEPIGNAIKTLEKLRKAGKKIGYITNNSSRTGEEYVKRLKNIGFWQEGDFVYSALDSAVDYILEKRREKKILAICTKQVFNYLQTTGLNFVNEDNCSNVDDVLITFDKELNYKKIQIANDWLVRGAFYMVTHPDTVCPTKGIAIPDLGSFINMFKTSSGRMPDICLGKPESYMANFISQKTGIPKNKMVMVGDRLKTDILFANNSGFTSVLVLSGVTDKKMASKSKIKADFILQDVNCFAQIFN